jgi:hypothetical protein
MFDPNSVVVTKVAKKRAKVAPRKPQHNYDLEAMEREYAPGIRSVRDIAREFGCNEKQVRRFAEKYNWERDVQPQIENRKIRLVQMANVRNQEIADIKRNHPRISDKELIEFTAENQARISLHQQKRIDRSVGIFETLLSELEAQVSNPAIIAELAQYYLDNGELTDRQFAEFKKMLGMSSKVDTFKKLIDSQKLLTEMERSVYNIKDSAPNPGTDAVEQPVTNFLNSITSRLNAKRTAN